MDFMNAKGKIKKRINNNIIYFKEDSDKIEQRFVEKEGHKYGLSLEKDSNGTTRYRSRLAEGVPGIWVSKNYVLNTMVDSILKPTDDRTIDNIFVETQADLMRSMNLPRADFADSLVQEYGRKHGITHEKDKNNTVRYRQKTVEGTPGQWISLDNVLKTLNKEIDYSKSMYNEKNFNDRYRYAAASA